MGCIICTPDTALYIRIPSHTPYTCQHACIQQTASFHCERARGFSASKCEVSVRACASAFETSVQAHWKVQISSSTFAGKHRSRSVASSTLTVKLCCRSVAPSTLAAKLRSLESIRSFDRTRSFAATLVEASTHSSGSQTSIHSRLLFFFSETVDGPS